MTVYYAHSTHPRMIDGKLFMAHTFSSSKEQAKKTARRLRKNGYMARILRTGKVWSVYYRLSWIKK